MMDTIREYLLFQAWDALRNIYEVPPFAEFEKRMEECFSKELERKREEDAAERIAELLDNGKRPF